VPVLNAPHHNAFVVDPNLKEIDYEDEDEDSDEEEEYEDLDFEDARDFSQDEDFYKSNSFSDEDDVSLGLSEYCVPSARGHGSGQRPEPGRPDKPNTAGMSEQEALFALLQWQAIWKSDKDRDRRRIAQIPNLTIDFMGVVLDIMRIMTEVFASRLQVGHTLPTKDILLCRIAEEANLLSVRTTIKRSDKFQMMVMAINQEQDPFLVHSSYSMSNDWKVTVYVEGSGCLTLTAKRLHLREKISWQWTQKRYLVVRKRGAMLMIPKTLIQ